MFDLKKLEIKKLIKEFEYVKSDYEYKSEIIREADSQFLENVDIFVGKNVELKNIYKEKVDIKLKDKIEEKVEFNKDEYVINQDVNKNDKNDKNDKLKRLYYQIAKLTHPDKIDQERLNNLYLEASKCYEVNDIIGIYQICDDLFIKYDIEESDIEMIKDNIKLFKDRISFIENTFTWKWYNSGEDTKKEMILKYIRKQIIYQDI